MADRDQALVNILERLAGDMTNQDRILDSLLERHDELVKAVESAGLHLRGKQNDTERSYDKLSDGISNYRSDMLSIVREQDRISSNIEELSKQLKATTYTVDIASKKLISIDERLSRQEKTSKEHFEFTSKQQEAFKDAIIVSSRDFSKLHMSTEKHISEFQNEVADLLNSFQHETLRRLLLLDGIITSLEVLLTRTAPPEKNPPWIKRFFIKIRGFSGRKFHFPNIREK